MATDKPRVMTIGAAAMAAMRKRGGVWAVYENQALDSSNLGHLQFLKVGPGCTFECAPGQYPSDNVNGMGWRYRFVGWADLVTEKVVDQIPTGADAR